MILNVPSRYKRVLSGDSRLRTRECRIFKTNSLRRSRNERRECKRTTNAFSNQLRTEKTKLCRKDELALHSRKQDLNLRMHLKKRKRKQSKSYVPTSNSPELFAISTES